MDSSSSKDESNEHGEAKCSGPRRAVIEAALARRLRHEMEAAHTESTLFARRRRLRGWSLYRRQTTELPRAGPAVCPARHCTRRGSCSGSIDPRRRAQVPAVQTAAGLLSLTSLRAAPRARVLAAPRARVDVVEYFIQIPSHRVGADLDGLGEPAQTHVLVDRGNAQVGELQYPGDLDQLPVVRGVSRTRSPSAAP